MSPVWEMAGQGKPVTCSPNGGNPLSGTEPWTKGSCILWIWEAEAEEKGEGQQWEVTESGGRKVPQHRPPWGSLQTVAPMSESLTATPSRKLQVWLWEGQLLPPGCLPGQTLKLPMVGPERSHSGFWLGAFMPIWEF